MVKLTSIQFSLSNASRSNPSKSVFLLDYSTLRCFHLHIYKCCRLTTEKCAKVEETITLPTKNCSSDDFSLAFIGTYQSSSMKYSGNGIPAYWNRVLCFVNDYKMKTWFRSHFEKKCQISICFNMSQVAALQHPCQCVLRILLKCSLTLMCYAITLKVWMYFFLNSVWSWKDQNPRNLGRLREQANKKVASKNRCHNDNDKRENNPCERIHTS